MFRVVVAAVVAAVADCAAVEPCRSHRRRLAFTRYVELLAWEDSRIERGILLVSVYTVSVLAILLCAFFNVVYGIRFTSKDDNRWITSVWYATVSGTRHWRLRLGVALC